MGCCGQNPVGSGAVAVDACKRVNYTLGMLLGVDDFVQESAWHTARRHALARETLGYGTVRGLDVVIEPDGDRGPRLRVTPGIAWLPSGTPVCVDAEQCCNLNAWLGSHAAKVEGKLAADSPPANIVLHVVLSYAQCLTDNVPIPGEPCRSEDELMKPSRVADGFRLELRLDAPPQREEDAVRDFVDWLARIPVVTDSPPLDETSFLEQVRAAAQAWLEPTSPPVTPGDFMFGLPSGELRADEGLMRAALRLWTTELRALWMARPGCGCGPQAQADADDAVLLATLDVPLVPTGAAAGWRVSDAADDVVLIDETRRPVLLSLRMVQELITQNPMPQVGDSVVPANEFGLPPDAGIDSAYSRADHSHGTPTLPNLDGDVTGALDTALVVGLRGRGVSANLPALNDALLFDGTQWAPGKPIAMIPPFGGDLAGSSIGSERLASLQGHLLVASAPGEGEVLSFVGGQWVPAPLPAPAPPPAPAPAPASDFVGRTAGPYEIVAAGEIEVDLGNGRPRLSERHSYGGLTATGVDPGETNEFALVQLRAKVPEATRLNGYVVKLTPIRIEKQRPEFKLYLFENNSDDPEVSRAVQAEGDNINFVVVIAADSQIVDGEFRFRFQVEVSRFGGVR